LTDNSHASKVLWLALALVLLAAALFKPALRLLFAIDYTEEIAAAAAAYGLDPLLVAAWSRSKRLQRTGPLSQRRPGAHAGHARDGRVGGPAG